MVNQKNCQNCGAPYDPSLSKCPYCGTTYFDMSVIDFDHRKPFWLKNHINGYEMTQYVVPELVEIETSYDEVYAYGGYGNHAAMIVRGSSNISTNPLHANEYVGLSTDEKPTNVPNASSFYEMDTKKMFRYDADSGTWLESFHAICPPDSGALVTMTKL